MNSIVILCGGNNSGKTTTLEHFFESGEKEDVRQMPLYSRVLNGKLIYAVSPNSPQELKDFCKVEEVIDNIEKRIRKCE